MYLSMMGSELTLQQSVSLHGCQCECTALQRMAMMLCLYYIFFTRSVKIEQTLLAFARDIFLIPRKYQALLQTMVESKYLEMELRSPSKMHYIKKKRLKVTYIFSYILQTENKRHFPTFIRSSNTPLKIPKYLLSKDCGWLTAGNCKKYTVNILIMSTR